MLEDKATTLPPELWLFGYGSLIWKPPPHYDLRIPGYITGYIRRFWQASEDHRGTLSSPGRVVTLISRSDWHRYHLGDTSLSLPTSTETKRVHDDRVYGAAYRIPPQHVREVRDYLDIREVNGYSIQYTTFYPLPPHGTPAKTSTANTHSGTNHSDEVKVVEQCMLYIGLPSNPQFLGRQSQDAVAAVIARSEGPSGQNREYLFMLEEALREIIGGAGGGVGGEGDGHVADLVRRVRGLEGEGVVGVFEGVEMEVKRVGKGEGGRGRGDEEVESGV
ncbi:hypothetical protein MMC21_000492 [Puttea exsequens]|nr:hypothetical protein [Puttea exsequens]